jgi:hypothetical protein
LQTPPRNQRRKGRCRYDQSNARVVMTATAAKPLAFTLKSQLPTLSIDISLFDVIQRLLIFGSLVILLSSTVFSFVTVQLTFWMRQTY